MRRRQSRRPRRGLRSLSLRLKRGPNLVRLPLNRRPRGRRRSEVRENARGLTVRTASVPSSKAGLQEIVRKDSTKVVASTAVIIRAVIIRVANSRVAISRVAISKADTIRAGNIRVGTRRGITTAAASMEAADRRASTVSEVTVAVMAVVGMEAVGMEAGRAVIRGNRADSWIAAGFVARRSDARAAWECRGWVAAGTCHA